MTTYNFKSTSELTERIRDSISYMESARHRGDSLKESIHGREEYVLFCEYVENRLISEEHAKDPWNDPKYDESFCTDFIKVARDGKNEKLNGSDKLVSEIKSFYDDLKKFKELPQKEFDILKYFLDKLAARCNHYDPDRNGSIA